MGLWRSDLTSLGLVATLLLSIKSRADALANLPGLGKVVPERGCGRQRQPSEPINVSALLGNVRWRVFSCQHVCGCRLPSQSVSSDSSVVFPPPVVRRRIDACLTDSNLFLHNEERNTSVLKPGDNHTTAPDTQQGEDHEHEDVTSQFKKTRSS